MREFLGFGESSVPPSTEVIEYHTIESVRDAIPTMLDGVQSRLIELEHELDNASTFAEMMELIEQKRHIFNACLELGLMHDMEKHRTMKMGPFEAEFAD